MIYLAAPFFTPDQLVLVQKVENLMLVNGIEFFSPRSEGVLNVMTKEERAAAAPAIFRSNVEHIMDCKSMLCLLDYPDMGTTWEAGFAFACNRRLIAYKSDAKTVNVMLAQCFTSITDDFEKLVPMLKDGLKEKVMIGDIE